MAGGAFPLGSGPGPVPSAASLGASPASAASWGVELCAAAEARRVLVATFPRLGDVEAGGVYDERALSERPMVTWCPPGRQQDRFCLLLVASHGREPDTASLAQLLWLVADIPGSTGGAEATSSDEVSSFGLAGNCDAVPGGREVAAFEAPSAALHGRGGRLILLIFEQRHGGSKSFGPLMGGVRRDNFDLAGFLRDNQLGAAVASEEIRVASAVVATAEVVTPSTPPQNGGGPALAHSIGAELEFDSYAPETLAAALCRTAETRPTSGLTLYDPGGKQSRLTYAELLARAGRLAAGLGTVTDLAAGDAGLLQLPPFGDHFVVFWACLLMRVRPVAVAIPPNYGDGAHAVCLKIKNIWQLLDGPPIITTAAHASKVEILRTSAGMSSLSLVHVEDLEGAAAIADVFGTTNAIGMAYLVSPSDVAFYQLSSGSTGVPKCIQVAHRGVVAHIHGEAQLCGFGPADVHVNFLPLDHVVPILTVHCCDVYHGCEEVQADVAWVVSEPLRWLRLLTEHAATRTWAPNFAFKLVADALRGRPDAGGEAFDLSRCRYWMNAGEQVTMPVCEDFLERTRRFGVRRAAMQPAFGMAEACTCMTYNNDFAVVPAARLDRSTFVNLGAPVPGIEIRIADEAGVTLHEEVIGRFQIRGPVITPGYLKNDEANEAAFVGDQWFNTGDVGFIKDGRLYLTGREKEMIIVRGANFYCYEVEDVVNVLPSVTPTFTAAVSAHDPSTGTEGLAIFFVPRALEATFEGDAQAAVVREVRGELAKRIGLVPSVVVALAREEFPKTTSGKIQRGDLAKALRAGAFDARLS